MIQKAEERAEFWRELRIKLVERGLWAAMTAVAAAAFWYLKREFQK